MSLPRYKGPKLTPAEIYRQYREYQAVIQALNSLGHDQHPRMRLAVSDETGAIANIEMDAQLASRIWKQPKK
jgi:penicillin V acylase-like amidase (Ntn superfamily)